MLARWCIFLWIVLAHIEGIYLFLSGFLLNRTVIPEYSHCHGPNSPSSLSKQFHGCWLPKRFNRSILLLIDALRFDFVEMQTVLPGQSATPYQNKLPIINLTLTTHPNNSRLYKFIADPPTSTMQRLKGLTTGSLPTFVDVGSNFASAAIDEDNWLEQLRRMNCNTVFMGDDTWMQLFPDAFARSWPFPSFNVKDLHTVDNGIIENLLPQIQHGDWEILIAHFLGVDHCGHRFGPEHPAMADKLTQMNEVIRSVMSALSDDTVLFVLGDHGMTWSGDHGGDSYDEVASGLFAYSKQPLSSAPHPSKVASVSQIDFVPTLSLLLGLPIPFNNLGAVIPEFFVDPANGTSLLHALHINAQQVDRFLQAYRATSSDLPEAEFMRLAQQHQGLETAFFDFSVRTAHSQEMEGKAVFGYQNFLHDAQAMCRQAWAQFDLFRMVCGIVVLAFSSLTTALLVLCLSYVELHQLCARMMERHFLLFNMLAAAAGFACVFLYNLPPYLPLFVITVTTSVSICLSCLWRHGLDKRWAKGSFSLLLHQALLPSVFLLAHSTAFFSNSFIVREDGLVLFTSLSMLSVVGLILWPLSSHNTTRRGGVYSVKVLCSLLVVRLAVVFRGCREEQHECSRSSFLLHSSTALAHLGWSGYVRLMACCCTVLAIPFVLRQQFAKREIVCASRCLQQLIAYALPLSGAGVAGHFSLQSLPPQLVDSLPAWIHVLYPRVVYAICCVVFICVFLCPVFQVARMGHRSHELRLLQSLSAGTIVVVVSMWLPLVMVLGDGLVPAGLLMLLEIVLVLLVISHDKAVAGSWLHVCLWSALMASFYFTTGHQYDLPSLRHDAAFVGLHGDVENFTLPVMLVVCNMFASQIVFSLTVPLVGVAARFRLLMEQQQQQQQRTSSNTETSCIISTVFRSCLMFLLYHSVTLAAAATAAFILRRHLMVWKIFAPRLLYAAVYLLVVDSGTILAFALVARTASVMSWRKLNEPHQHVT